MNFFTALVQLMAIVAIVDGVVVMVGGLVLAALFLLGRQDLIDKLSDRASPAFMTILVTSVGSIVILGVGAWLYRLGIGT